MGVKKETTSLSVLHSSYLCLLSCHSSAQLQLLLPPIPSTTFCPYATWSHKKK